MNALVTGGAGFIGSSLVRALIERGHPVRVLDDLTTGYVENLHQDAEFIRGDVADAGAVANAVDNIEVVFHHAAHRSIAGSIESPLAVDTANTHGTLTVLKAALDAGVRRVVYASSSSVYGGAQQLPTPETAPTNPRSPYAVTKLAGEHYARVFSELHELETVILRYFNVFGPRQRPDSAYAAVVPLFIDALQHGRQPVVHGDGRQSRDFTYVDDVVAANLAAAESDAASCSGHVYNVAGGVTHSVLDLLATLGRIIGVKPQATHTGPRPGDVRDSWADISAARRDLAFEPAVDFEDGLRRTVAWFAQP